MNKSYLIPFFLLFLFNIGFSLFDNYIYVGGQVTQEVWKLYANNLTYIENSTAYGGNINSVTHDNNYVYFGGAGNQSVWKLYKNNLTFIENSINYGGMITAIAVDYDYVYISGYTTQEIWKLYKNNLTYIENSTNYGGAITTMVIDDDYVYLGGYTNQSVWKLYKDNLTFIESIAYDGIIRDLKVDDNYVYVVGSTNNSIWKLYKDNLTFIENSISYGQYALDLAIDDDYIYMTGQNNQSVWKFYKNNLTFIENSIPYPATIQSVVVDDDYVYVGGNNKTVWKFYKNNLTYIENSIEYGLGNNVIMSLSRSLLYYTLLNNTFGEKIIHNSPLDIKINITMNLTDDSISNTTDNINVSVYNMNTSTQDYFNLTRTQGEMGGESYGEYVFKAEDVGSCLNFSYTFNDYDYSTYNESIICDTQSVFNYIYITYYLENLKTWLDTKFDLVFEYLDNITYKLDNLNISGNFSGEMNLSIIESYFENITNQINSLINPEYFIDEEFTLYYGEPFGAGDYPFYYNEGDDITEVSEDWNYFVYNAGANQGFKTLYLNDSINSMVGHYYDFDDSNTPYFVFMNFLRKGNLSGSVSFDIKVNVSGGAGTFISLVDQTGNSPAVLGLAGGYYVAVNNTDQIPLIPSGEWNEIEIYSYPYDENYTNDLPGKWKVRIDNITYPETDYYYGYNNNPWLGERITAILLGTIEVSDTAEILIDNISSSWVRRCKGCDGKCACVNTSVCVIDEETAEEISLIKKINICLFKQYEQVEDYYNYCFDYANPFNITEMEENENIALNLTAYWLNASLYEQEQKEFNPENCFNLDKYKNLLNLTDYFILNGLITAGSLMIDNSYCWLKLGFKIITSVKT